VVKNTGSRFPVNMISAVSAKDALRFAVYDGTTTAATFIDFCKRCCTTPPTGSTWSWTGIPRTARPPRRSSPPPPGAGSSWFTCPATHPSSTPMGIWSLLKRSIANFAAADQASLVRIIKRKRRRSSTAPT
jgi:hypothetical protein